METSEETLDLLGSNDWDEAEAPVLYSDAASCHHQIVLAGSMLDQHLSSHCPCCSLVRFDRGCSGWGRPGGDPSGARGKRANHKHRYWEPPDGSKSYEQPGTD